MGTVAVARSTHGKVNKKLVLTFISFKELLGLFAYSTEACNHVSTHFFESFL